jgi:hypothetical protein
MHARQLSPEAIGASPAQSFSGPSTARIMTKCYCLRFETPPTWRAGSPFLYPQVKVKVTLWLTVSQSVNLGVELSLGR